MNILEQIDHRPWPLPAKPWIMTQTWNDLLFAHWPVSPALIQSLIPKNLELDTFEGQAWVGVVPFHMSGIRLRGMPPVPYMSAFPELNVRTYVVVEGKPGVCFFSLDASNSIAVWTARKWFRLPYFKAKFSVRASDDWIKYSCRRTHRRAPSAEFTGRYRPTSGVFHPQPGTFEHWLTERYCLYTVDRDQQIYRGDIHHLPWPLQQADAEIDRNDMTRSHKIVLPDTKPILHYAKRIETFVWPLRKVETISRI